MAIDPVKKLFLLVPVSETQTLIERLHELRLVHLSDSLQELKGVDRAEVERNLRRAYRSPGHIEEKLKKLGFVLEVFDRFVPRKRNLAENFVTLPLQVTKERLREVVGSFDLDGVHAEIRDLHEEFTSLEKEHAALESERDMLSPLAVLPFKPALVLRLKYVKVVYGIVPAARLDVLEGREDARDFMDWEVVSSDGVRCNLLEVYLKSREQDAMEVLRSAGFVEVEIPELEKPAAERLEEIRKSLEEIERRKGEILERITKLAEKREDAEIVRAYWEAEAKKVHAHSLMLSSSRIALLSGYVRVRDSGRLTSVVEKEFPSVTLLLQDPTPEDNVPVSLTLSKVFQPVQLLVNMFGLPNYFGFDPTPYLTISFLVFFGVCFGDAIYGLMLMGFSAYLMHKARNYPNLRNFCAFFLYAGISTFFFGAITGAWASDLANPEYLGEGNILLRLRNKFLVFDPMNNTVMALVIALMIGVINQFYGIVLRIYREVRRRDYIAAIFDGGSWLVMLPGLIITISRLFITPPQWVVNLGLWMLIIGAVMLISSQGRHEKTLAAKLITGVVSIYGILGSYGCTSFIGDVLSYSRLLALGFTTTIVGMAFNILAGLLKDISFVGMLLFVLVLLFGHVFNFAMSILSAFVHSARLIFLEFFSRFYEGGALRFEPFGFGSERVELMESQ